MSKPSTTHSFKRFPEICKSLRGPRCERSNTFSLLCGFSFFFSFLFPLSREIRGFWVNRHRGPTVPNGHSPRGPYLTLVGRYLIRKGGCFNQKSYELLPLYPTEKKEGLSEIILDVLLIAPSRSQPYSTEFNKDNQRSTGTLCS